MGGERTALDRKIRSLSEPRRKKQEKRRGFMNSYQCSEKMAKGKRRKGKERACARRKITIIGEGGGGETNENDLECLVYFLW